MKDLIPVRLLLLALLLSSSSLSAFPLAVTIDDLPMAHEMDHASMRETNRKVIAALSAFSVPAIGFVNEGKLYTADGLDDERVEALRDWLDAGLELGNHGWSHMSLHATPVKQYLDDIVRGERITRSLMEEKRQVTRYFRHPHLHTGRSAEVRAEVDAFLAEHGYTVAPVTIDNSEWIYALAYERAHKADDKALAARIGTDYIDYMLQKTEYYRQQANALFGREIAQVLLVHLNRLNADHLRGLLERLEQQEARFVTLESAIEDEAYESADDYFGPGGITWIHRWAITAGKKRAFFGDEPTVPEWVMGIAGLEQE